MPVDHHLEREVTFDVPADWAVPDLTPLVPDGGRQVLATHTLSAIYYDTPRNTLRQLGFTLRKRTGGEDDGWHLKVPAGEGRTEVQVRSRAKRVPAELLTRVAGVVGSDRVAPVATVDTERTTTRVLTAEGELLLEVADDRVIGTPAAEGDAVRWREVEVELGPVGDEDTLDAVSGLFAGATPATVSRKINHVLGEPRWPSFDGLTGRLADYLREQSGAVLIGDVRLRDDPTPDAVHRTRVALRRLRSTLRIFGSAVDAPRSLDDELRWLASLLSPIRDSDILERRLDDAVGALPPGDLVGPVRREIAEALRERRRVGLAELEEAWEDPRYHEIMAVLVDWYASPPVHAQGRVHGRARLRKADRTFRKRLRRADDAHGLHQARKAAKRLRYAGELLGPDVKGAPRAARQAERWQTELGTHQDLTVAADLVRELGRSDDVGNGFAYGMLAERFDREAALIRRKALR